MRQELLQISDPYTELFFDAVKSAKEEGASDIHIQPTLNGIDLRFRVSGDLYLWKQLGIEHQLNFINTAKKVSCLSIAMSGKPQDGRVSFKSLNLDLRASLLPSQYGEKIVLRLLDSTRSFDLKDVGFNDSTITDLRKALQLKNGVIIISGPTGSGKSTTLYSLLNTLNTQDRNIITLEDPIEYTLSGITQVQINSKIGFSDALRAVLRQDPDVILVGEVRDKETADLCMRAASTGHLVLSTLHANGSREVVSRLLNLGVDSYTIKSVLRFSAAQRLLKKLCKECSERLSKQEVLKIEKECVSKLPVKDFAGFRSRNLKGCKNCNSGITGRLPILEYMGKNEIENYLQAGGTPKISLFESTALLAEKGIVDFEEVFEIE